MLLKLHQDPDFLFLFDEPREIKRIHLEGASKGTRVILYRINPATRQRLEILTHGKTGDNGWVDLEVEIIVRSGEGFIAQTV